MLDLLAVLTFVAVVVVAMWVRERRISLGDATAHDAYLATEVHAERGPLFLDLCQALDDCRAQGPFEELVQGRQYRLETNIELLEPPDLYPGDLDGGDCELAYFHDRDATRDWVAYVTFSAGRLVRMGYCESSVNDHSAWSTHEAPPGATVLAGATPAPARPR